MAATEVASGNRVRQWNKRILREWNRKDPFGPYTSKSVNAIIQVVEDLTGLPGDRVTQSLVTRLTNNPTTGDNTLHGNEEAVGNYSYEHTVAQFRHAVLMGHAEQKKTHIQMLEIARPLLVDWLAAYHRDEVIAAMYVMNTDGATRYASTSETDKDTAFAANSDRVLMGVDTGHYSGVHSDDLAKITATTDDFDPEVLSIMKRLAKLADPHIHPVSPKGTTGEFYVAFAPSYTFRDFKTSASQLAAHQYAASRGKGNPLFTDNSLYWDGTVVTEVPEIDALSSVGASNIDVGPVFFCGAQAIGYAVGERVNHKKDQWDYDNQKGVAIAEISVVNKLIFNSKFHGMVTGYFPCVGD
jgi:N4-gp56 family major capsid protein